MAEPLKNMFNIRFFTALTSALKTAYSDFNEHTFMNDVLDPLWESRELKQRMRHITTCIHDALPHDYDEALVILRRAAPLLTGFTFENMIFPDYVEVYGLQDWDVSLPALEQFTQQSSAEFAVRPFIMSNQQRMMTQMLEWAKHDSPHVRRLASEGCRPRLPWAMALPTLKTDPTPIFPILEQLKMDDSEYVRRSVANNLNDIAKDHPQLVIDLLRRWRIHETPDMNKLINHALRTLIKQGNTHALALLGYNHSTQVTVSALTVSPQTITMGGELIFSFSVESVTDHTQTLLIDYVVHHIRANGQQTPKVFKLTKVTLAAHEVQTFRKKHSFRAITTRKYYPGEHSIEIQVNGVSAARANFQITLPAGSENNLPYGH